MFGRCVWYLLAGLCALLAPNVVGQTAQTGGARQISGQRMDRVRLAPTRKPRIFQPTRIPYLPIAPSPEGEFSQCVRAAGTIFSGTVKRVQRRPATRGQSVETVAITFHVENAIRGVALGRDVTISQWIGLWSSGQRYRLGERVLLLLYPRSKLGLTSSVAGSVGRFELDELSRVLLSAQHRSAFRANPVLGGRSHVSLSDFALAVRQASEEDGLKRGDHEN
jgi:hypothetical protein